MQGNLYYEIQKVAQRTPFLKPDQLMCITN